MNSIAYQVKNPIVIFIFLRLESTLKLIDRLREVNARKIYIVGEGYRPNREGEALRVEEVRRQVENSIDWDCEIHTNYVPIDIGAGPRISSGISWVFETEERAIFLEDDIMPNVSFFRFCDEMLDYYENHPQIMAISGHNAIPEYVFDHSYTFSSIPFVWGWATWKRAWEGYDFHLSSWEQVKKNKTLKRQFKNKIFYQFRSDEYDMITSGATFTWDYQFSYHLLINSGLSVVPHYNLTSNVGIGPDATNTKESKEHQHLPQELDFPLNHPHVIECNQGYDDYYFKHFLFASFYNHFGVRLKYYIRRILGNTLTDKLKKRFKRS